MSEISSYNVTGRVYTIYVYTVVYIHVYNRNGEHKRSTPLMLQGGYRYWTHKKICNFFDVKEKFLSHAEMTTVYTHLVHTVLATR